MNSWLSPKFKKIKTYLLFLKQRSIKNNNIYIILKNLLFNISPKINIKYLLNLFKNKKILFILGSTPIVNVILENEDLVSDNSQALVPVSQQPNHVDRLEEFAKTLSNEVRPFSEDFPKYDPNTPLIPVKIVNGIINIFKSEVSDLISMTINKIGSSGAVGIFQQNFKEKEGKIIQDYNDIPEQGIQDYIIVSKSAGKPLGEYGEVSLNQIITFFSDMDLADISPYLRGSISVIGVGFLYKTIVNTYFNQFYPKVDLDKLSEGQRLEWLSKRSKALKTFSIVYAPLIALALYHATKIKVESKNSGVSILESIMLLFSKKKIKYNNRYLSSNAYNNFNNNDINRYKYYAMLMTFVLLIISNYLSIKSIFLFYIIVFSIYLLYLIFDLLIFILYIKNKITTPIYLPDFIRNWFLKKEDIVKGGLDDIRVFLGLDIKKILLNIVSIFILIVMYFFL